MDLSAIVDLAGVAATGILFLLIGLSVVQLAILVERAVVFARTRLARPRRRRLARALESGRLDEAAGEARSGRSLADRVLEAALERAGDGPEVVEDVARARTAEGRLELEARLSFLATLGNNAPFIGLLGTVLGIIHAFANLQSSAGQISTEVMAGISEALVSTGVGLIVALPAVIGFNWFQRVVKARVVAAETLTDTLLAALRRRAARGRVFAVDEVEAEAAPSAA